MNKKILLIISCTILAGIIVVFAFGYFVFGPITFINDNDLNSYSKQWLSKFYNEFPEIISEGEHVDIKYVDFNQFSQRNSTFAFVFKGDEYKKIKSMELIFTVIDSKENKKETLLVKDFDPFRANTLYNDRQTLGKKAVRIRLLQIEEFGGEALSYFSETNNDVYDISNIEIKLYYDDYKTDVETHKLSVDYEKMLTSKLIEIDDDISNIIMNFDPNDEILLENFNNYVMNLDEEYVYSQETGYTKILNFFQMIEDSPNKKQIVENTFVFDCLISTPFYEMTYEQLNEIYNHVKILYDGELDLNKSQINYLKMFLSDINSAASYNGFNPLINEKNLSLDYSEISYKKLFE